MEGERCRWRFLRDFAAGLRYSSFLDEALTKDKNRRTMIGGMLNTIQALCDTWMVYSISEPLRIST